MVAQSVEFIFVTAPLFFTKSYPSGLREQTTHPDDTKSEVEIFFQEDDDAYLLDHGVSSVFIQHNL